MKRKINLKGEKRCKDCHIIVSDINKSGYCGKCYATYYRSTEEFRKYRQRPDVKAKMKEYFQRPDVKAKMKEYFQRPDVKAKMKEYFQRPEIRERMKIYNKEYYQKNKEKILKQKKEYYQKIKMKNKIIYPNCSEIVWRLDVDKDKSTKIKILKALDNKKEKCHRTYMAGDFPNKFLKEMIDCLKEEKKDGYNLKDIRLKMVNSEGEDWGFIKKGFRLAKSCLNKEMGRREAQKLLEKHFDDEQERELSEEEDE